MTFDLLQSPPPEDGSLGNIPDALKVLFDRDPLSLSRIELNSIVAELRASREAFVRADAEAQAAGKRVKVPSAEKPAKPAKGEKPKLSINLTDLLSDL